MWFPVAGSASGLRQPVHADDLAAAAVAALTVIDRLPAELFLSGATTLTYREMLRRIAGAHGRKLRVLPMPLALLSGLLSLLRWLPGMREIKPEMLRRQNVDLVFDDAPARELLGYRPRAFRPRDEDFRRPEEQVLLHLAEVEE